ncbi:MAG: hypothetical protein J6B92_02490 [Paraprevotella sp.]|nr:hypothetical protein [Paraprevotella sp.]
MEQRYLGIIPYDGNGNYEFAGRGEETWALYDRIIRNEYTVYYAASGEGKSSLIRAGLLPILRRRDFFPVYIVFEDKELENISSINEVINKRIEHEIKMAGHEISYEQSIWSKSYFNEEQSEVLKNNLWWKLRNYSFKNIEENKELKPLFIFDQFEEVFAKAKYEWTDLFFSWLEEISTDYIPSSLREIINSWKIDVPTQKNFKALFSFRTEYLGDLDYWCIQKHFLPSLQENRMCLKPLTPKGAREIIGLNESSLGACADKIIQGCSEASSDISNESQPCVYALILSVVCHTLSENSDKDRISLLENLKNNQDNTIDDILLRFYKEKLKAAGLDYIRDEKIIADIENALVDEKGKRSRRDTDESSMLPLSKWVKLLCDKNNGLLKIIAKKEVGGIIVNTVEFPHDRLCKAIDASRKERQGKIAWRLNRQKEWLQFGIISMLVGIIAFLWNVMMPAIAPIITAFLRKDCSELGGAFLNYLQMRHSEYIEISCDEGFSTLFLMFSLLSFPLVTTFIVRKNKRWQLSSFMISLLSFLSFVFLWYRNRDIDFANDYVPVLTLVGLSASLACLCVLFLRLRTSVTREETEYTRDFQTSNWPLWGGCFVFAVYVFYEFLCRTTFGINEPCDSSWGLMLLPLLFTMWSKGFFNMVTGKNIKVKILTVVSILFLMCLFIISFIPFYNVYKQSFGFTVSIIIIILWLFTLGHIIWQSKSNSYYYLLTNGKRSLALILSALVIISTFLLNLGYNPIAISSTTVWSVHSWRTVLVSECDSVGNKKLGILYAADGDTIVPCCYCLSNEEIDSIRLKDKWPQTNKIKTSFGTSPFENKSVISNNDSSLVWNSVDCSVSVSIPVAPTLEQYLHRKISKGLSANSMFTDSIDYYAACLFDEIRKANIKYIIKGKSYNLSELDVLEKLDSLQHIALYKELHKFSDTIIVGGSRYPRIEVLEDEHLVDFHRELSRSFFLCLVKDRVLHSDMPAMFTLAKIYLMTFFTSVPAMNLGIHCSVSNNIVSNIDTIISKSGYTIYSNDIVNRKIFAYYDLFNMLCTMDMEYNNDTFLRIYSGKNQSDSLIYYGIKLKEILEKQQISNTHFKSLKKTFDNEIGKKDSLSAVLSLLGNALEEESQIRSELKIMNDSISLYLDKIGKPIKFLAVDQSLKHVTDTVFNTLSPIMEKHPNGIYNNAFENICKNIILVTAIRGNDIQEDTTELSTCFKTKYQFYNVVKDICGEKHLKEVKSIKEELERLLENIGALL